MKYRAVSVPGCSIEDGIDLVVVLSPTSGCLLGGRRRFSRARESSISFLAMPSCHCTISGSHLEGKASLGSRLGKRVPLAGLIISNLLTAFCRKETCSSGSSSICTVCQRTKPCGVKAGTEGALCGLFSCWRVWKHPNDWYMKEREG